MKRERERESTGKFQVQNILNEIATEAFGERNSTKKEYTGKEN